MKFCENSTFFCIWIFYFKNKLYYESRFWLRKKQFFGRKYRNCWPKLFFLWTIKTREILRKQHFFLNLNFLFLKIQWKLVLATKTAIVFADEFFISEKIKCKSVLAAKTAVSKGENTVKIFGLNPAFTHLFWLCVVHIPHVWFLSKCPAGKIFGGNCCENRTKIKHKKQNFWTKMLQKTYFLKKKTFF